MKGCRSMGMYMSLKNGENTPFYLVGNSEDLRIGFVDGILIAAKGKKGIDKNAKQGRAVLVGTNKGVAILTEYRFGKGHHILMKSHYRSDEVYNERAALCLGDQEMKRFGFSHDKATTVQRIASTKLRRMVKVATREEMDDISVKALADGGLIYFLQER